MNVNQLITERDIILVRLEARWQWLDDHDGHPATMYSEQMRERENAVLADLKSYEDIETALGVLAA